MLERNSWKGCKNFRNKNSAVYTHEQRRMETTFSGGQDSYRVAKPVMMMMMMMVVVVTMTVVVGNKINKIRHPFL
jgi:PP-loop superfamily ATP-utilizing enzyme